MLIHLWRKSCWTANENVVEASLALIRAKLHTVTQSFEAISEPANGAAKHHEEELEELLPWNEIVLLEAARTLNKLCRRSLALCMLNSVLRSFQLLPR